MAQSANDVFNALRLKVSTVTLDGVRDPIQVRELSLAARMEMQALPDTADRLGLIVKNGCPLFADTPAEELVERLPPAAIMALSVAVLQVSGLTDDDDEAGN